MMGYMIPIGLAALGLPVAAMAKSRFGYGWGFTCLAALILTDVYGLWMLAESLK